MHLWGSWPDEMFHEVDKAAVEIGTFLRKWGRICITCTKEKYGTARVYTTFGLYGLHSITHPGYAYSQYPRWLRYLDIDYISKLFELCKLNSLIIPIQIYLYNLAYQRAFKAHPKIILEIYYGADYPEYIKKDHELHSLLMKYSYDNGYKRGRYDVEEEIEAREKDKQECTQA